MTKIQITPLGKTILLFVFFSSLFILSSINNIEKVNSDKPINLVKPTTDSGKPIEVKAKNTIEKPVEKEKHLSSNLKYTKTVKTIVFKPKATIKSISKVAKKTSKNKSTNSIYISCSKKIIKSNLANVCKLNNLYSLKKEKIVFKWINISTNKVERKVEKTLNPKNKSFFDYRYAADSRNGKKYIIEAIFKNHTYTTNIIF